MKMLLKKEFMVEKTETSKYILQHDVIKKNDHYRVWNLSF